jgi:hypothetical protein
MRAAILSRYPGYVITDSGLIQGVSGRWLRPSADSDGYLMIRPCVHGKCLNVSVHKLVCLAFHGDPPSPAHQVRHLNGRRDDNRADNLAWGTAKDDGADRIRHGTTLRGEGHNLAKLTWSDVREIRRRYALGAVSQHQLALEFSISQSAIGSVVNGRTWTNPKKEGQ